ncbi:hypothetical protein HDV00_008977 [Rhizophlyctis rosea]|nr:hypothetical protein HDV00_008977 [Rhizophlyctis rosea]
MLFDLMASVDIPTFVKATHLKQAVAPFHDENRANKKKGRNQTTQNVLSDTDKENWVHHRLLQQGFLEALPELFSILDKTKVTSEDLHEVYFWMFIALSSLLLRVPRGDAIRIRYRNYEDSMDPYIHEGSLYVKDSNKTGRTYTTPIPEILKPLLDKMVARSVKRDCDYVFVQQRGKKGFAVNKFNQTYVVPNGKRILEKELTVHRIRKSVATADYQRWKRRNGSINELFQMAANLDHDLKTHLIHYVHEEMNDPECLDTNIFGLTNFEGIAYVDEEQPVAEQAEADDMDVDE